MIRLNSHKEITDLIINNKMVIVYFTGSACGACEVIKGKIEIIAEDFPKILLREVNGEENITLAAQYSIFSLPIMILFIEGKEFLRVGRNINLLELKKDIERYYKMLFYSRIKEVNKGE